ncbi:hypothetical protein HZH68_001908 [Vespula germanica]|uniref:Uncharacterized protein n=1 Tax=Vespula germanica TaxID=30212 RepID=A0A834NLY8_VESGE|nr:hypothetical protein HZH68_001908 [Vespula germanica]
MQRRRPFERNEAKDKGEGEGEGEGEFPRSWKYKASLYVEASARASTRYVARTNDARTKKEIGADAADSETSLEIIPMYQGRSHIIALNDQRTDHASLFQVLPLALAIDLAIVNRW